MFSRWCLCVCGLYNSVDTVDFGVQVLVLRLVRALSKAVSRHPVALTHRSLALVVDSCRERKSHETDKLLLKHKAQITQTLSLTL